MLDRLIEFYKSEPVNHWSSFLMFAIFVIGIIYVVKFYFSKEGKDERGREIFSEASFITFVAMTIWLFTLSGGSLYNFAISSKSAFGVTVYLSLDILFMCQTTSIVILKKMK